MGEAKWRGTEAERIEQAQSNRGSGLNQEVDMDRVQVLDVQMFSKISNWLMRGLQESMQTRRLDLGAYTVKGWAHGDGRLEVRLMFRSEQREAFEIPQGSWAWASAEVLAKAKFNLSTPQGQQTLQELGEIARKLEASTPVAANESHLHGQGSGDIDSVFVIVGRASDGVLFLGALTQESAYLRNAADTWISSGAKFIAIAIDRTDERAVPRIEFASDDGHLISILNSQIAGKSNMSNAGLSISGLDAKTHRMAADLWTSKGGVLVARNN